ncbi:hypothetical protein Hdeb2414_s0004g00138421 [Helianthus debilis subsp. tardiflorus]
MKSLSSEQSFETRSYPYIITPVQTYIMHYYDYCYSEKLVRFGVNFDPCTYE